MMKDDKKLNSDLVPVHGGLELPVDRRVPLSGRKAFLSEAEKLPSFEVSNADLSTVYRIADGTLSPLRGPMREEVWRRVLDESVIESQGDLYAWTIPLSLPLTDEEAGRLSSGGS
ncbi:MAG: sulfate adenylyltransferase, partial [Myxococcota bacterium]